MMAFNRMIDEHTYWVAVIQPRWRETESWEKYLRIIAGTLVTPVLVGMANLAGFLAGMAAAQATVGLGQESFLYGARLFWHSWDMFYSLMKATVFGFIIPLISCHMGLFTRGGAEGVGRSTTTAVVIMIITVLVLDALFPPLFLN